MFTKQQRRQILKWGGLTLFSLSLLPLLMHGLFFIVLFQYYIPAAIIIFALYFSYVKIQAVDIHDEEVLNVIKTFFTRSKK